MPICRPPDAAGIDTAGRILAGIGALFAVVLALSACTAPAADPEPTGLPDGVTVALVQLRSDVAARQAQVEVRNGSDAPVQIGDVAVSDPRFADAATRVLDRVTTVQPGRTVDIRIQLPEMACDASQGGSTVRLTLISGDTDEVRESPLPDKLDFLPPLHERECRARALADAATVQIASFEPSRAGAPADLVLEIRPTGQGSARIAAIQSTNLLTFRDLPAGRFPIDVAVAPGDTEPVVVHLPLVPLRCDPHAVQEDKRGTVFNIEVELDGGSGNVQVAASEDMRGRILTWVTQWCGYGS